MDYEAAGQDSYEPDSFCVADDESIVEHDSEGDALDHFEETEDTMRIGEGKMTRLKRATKRSRWYSIIMFIVNILCFQDIEQL